MRFGGYAVVDTVLTIIAAYLTSLLANVPFITSLLLWFFVGELMHITYGVQTAFLTALGIDVDC